MAEQPLTAEEALLWARVVAGVRPLARPRIAVKAPEMPVPPREPAPAPQRKGRSPAAPSPAPPPPPARPTHRDATLDAGWDRRLSRGLVSPDATIDLHGHSLDRAYARIDWGLEDAIRRGDRLIVLVTGKPRENVRPGDAGTRGAIRALVADWLAASRHAAAIAAVRGAHPRHGGAGALYLVLKRGR